MKFLDYLLYGNTVRAWAIALAIGLGSLVVLRVLLRLANSRISKWSQRTATRWDDLVSYVLGRTRVFFLAVLAIEAGSFFVRLAPQDRRVVATISALAFILQGGLWASAAVAFLVSDYRRRKMEEDRATVTTIGAINFLLQVLLWSAVLLIALDNLGIDVTALVTGLGVGGVAVALAVQNILGDLFASLAIVLDKPFVIGDFIIVEDFLGSVEKVGLKTTRVRSLGGEQIIFSNADLLKSRVRNYGRMMERRVVFTLGVTYQTPREKLKTIPAIIREAIEAQDKTRFDRSHFFKYGDFSLDFESVYYVLSPDYNVYMDRQQAINLRIHERFEAEGIEFAYPTQTLFVSRNDAQPAPAAS